MNIGLSIEVQDGIDSKMLFDAVVKFQQARPNAGLDKISDVSELA